MASPRVTIAFILVCLPLAVTQTSFLQLNQKHRLGKASDTAVELCTFGAGKGFDSSIKIFADESDNSRYVSFASATDDGFIESMQKCKGSMPDTCKKKNATSSPSGCAACPCELDLSHRPFGNYQRRMLALLEPRCQKKSFRVLLVGLGGGALVQYILGKCAQGTVVEAVEYDPRMIEVATRFFGLHASQDVYKVEQGDGGAVVADHVAQSKTFDMVLVDAFAGGSHVPPTCRDAKFVGNIRRMIKKGGVAVANMAGPTYHNLAGTDDYKTTLPLYEKQFGKSSTKLEELTGNMEFLSRLIVAHVPP